MVHLRGPDALADVSQPGAPEPALADAEGTGSGCARPTRVGLVVGRSVGGAVVRNRVSRRLRAHLAARLQSIPCGADVVIRALPSAARASWQDLARDTDRCLDRAVTKLGGVPAPRPGTVP